MSWRVLLGAAGAGTVTLLSIYVYRLATGDGLPSASVGQVPVGALIVLWVVGAVGHQVERAYLRGMHAGLDLAARQQADPPTRLRSR